MQKNTKKLAGGLETVRSDIQNGRLQDSDYMVRIERNSQPDSKVEWVKRAFAKGLTYRELIKGCGLRTRDVLRICGVNPDDCPELVAELDKFRDSFIISR
jgi:hypothetical protein